MGPVGRAGAGKRAMSRYTPICRSADEVLRHAQSLVMRALPRESRSRSRWTLLATPGDSQAPAVAVWVLWDPEAHEGTGPRGYVVHDLGSTTPSSGTA